MAKTWESASPSGGGYSIAYLCFVGGPILRCVRTGTFIPKLENNQPTFLSLTRKTAKRKKTLSTRKKGQKEKNARVSPSFTHKKKTAGRQFFFIYLFAFSICYSLVQLGFCSSGCKSQPRNNWETTVWVSNCTGAGVGAFQRLTFTQRLWGWRSGSRSECRTTQATLSLAPAGSFEAKTPHHLNHSKNPYKFPRNPKKTTNLRFEAWPKELKWFKKIEK